MRIILQKKFSDATTLCLLDMDRDKIIYIQNAFYAFKSKDGYIRALYTVWYEEVGRQR